MRFPSQHHRILLLVLAALLACPDEDALACDDGTPLSAPMRAESVLTPGAHLAMSPAPSFRNRPGSSTPRKRPTRTLNVTARDARDDVDPSDSGPDSSWPELRAVPDPSLDLRTPGGAPRGSFRTLHRAGLHTAVLGTRLRC